MHLNLGNAAPVLAELDRYPRVAIYESPIMQRDVEGQRQLRQKTTRPIALHFGEPPFPTAVREEVCDGFVVGGGVASVLRQGVLAAAFEKPFWLQLVGTGLTTAWTAQVGAVATHAQWPAVTCMHIWQDDLIVEPLQIAGGYAEVPAGPGLGVTLDDAAVERLRLPDQSTLPTRPRRLYTVSWPAARTDGRRGTTIPAGTATVAGFEHDLFREFDHGNLPRFATGIALQQRDDDRSPEFDQAFTASTGRSVRDAS